MSKREPSNVLVIGACSTDTKGHAGHPLESGTSTPGSVRTSYGGVGRNIAENLARLGERVILLSAVGDDESGRSLLHHAAGCGVDVSHVLVDPDHRTAAYVAILDQTGSPVVSIDDMVINRRLITPEFIYRRRALFRDASMIVLDANLSSATLQLIFRLAGHYETPVCADPTTATLAPRLCPHLHELLLVTPNASEAEALCGVRVTDRERGLEAARRLLSLGVGIAIITLGATGLVYSTSHESGHIPAVETEITDLTGAGDALTATVVFSLLNGFAVDEAVRLGTSAAALTLQCKETVCPYLSLERLYDQLVI